MTVAVAGLALVIWLGLAFCWHGFWKTDQRLPAGGNACKNLPRVTALVPARNEAETIGRCIRSLAGQNYAGAFEAVIINDNSSDDTCNIAIAAAGKGGRIRVIDAPELEAGWAGKLWALQHGLKVTSPDAPDYYWLTDGDISHGSDVLAGLVGHAEKKRLALASLMVRLPCEGFWERLLVPAFIFYFCLIYPFRAVNAPHSSIAGAAGGCMLLRADALEAIGGLTAVKGAVIDDCAIAKAIKRNGNATWLGLADDSYSLRGYDGLHDFWMMVVRSAYTQLRFSPVLLAGAIAGLIVTYLVPPVMALAMPFSFAGVLAIAAYAIMCVCYAPVIRYHDLPLGWAATLPAAALLFSLMTIHSAARHYLGRGIAWKGRALSRPNP